MGFFQQFFVSPNGFKKGGFKNFFQGLFMDVILGNMCKRTGFHKALCIDMQESAPGCHAGSAQFKFIIRQMDKNHFLSRLHRLQLIAENILFRCCGQQVFFRSYINGHIPQIESDPAAVIYILINKSIGSKGVIILPCDNG